MTQESADRLQEVMAGMLNLKLFVVVTKGKGLDLKPYLLEHLEWMMENEKKGLLFASGPTGVTGSGDGLTVLRVSSEAEARAIAEQDPFHKNNIRDFTIMPWTIMEGSFNATLNFSNGTFKLS